MWKFEMADFANENSCKAHSIGPKWVVLIWHNNFIFIIVLSALMCVRVVIYNVDGQVKLIKD